LLGGRVSVFARIRKAVAAAIGVGARYVELGARHAGPQCTASIAWARRCRAVASTRVASGRRHLVDALVARALLLGDTSSDLDKRADACRVVMWSLLAIAGLVWLALGWKAAAIPGLAAIAPAAMAVVLWDAAVDLEQREHPRWQRSA
ncbi:MAG TPA: hypothetical protein VNT02_00120, partial [Burkholderiales bacterium]|nr:hypothetical protein [Burkholderiales bacterium]